jgi:hypothetical protein
MAKEMEILKDKKTIISKIDELFINNAQSQISFIIACTIFKKFNCKPFFEKLNLFIVLILKNFNFL